MHREPYTIEILAPNKGDHPVVLDRVIGATVYMDEAKRIGRHLMSIVEGHVSPKGFRVLDHTQNVVYAWSIGKDSPDSID